MGEGEKVRSDEQELCTLSPHIPVHGIGTLHVLTPHPDYTPPVPAQHYHLLALTSRVCVAVDDLDDPTHGHHIPRRAAGHQVPRQLAVHRARQAALVPAPVPATATARQSLGQLLKAGWGRR